MSTTETTESTEAEAARRRSLPSTLLVAASVAAGVFLALWGLDRLARWAAESILARDIQLTTGVLERPDVDVNGWFFLPQVIQGRYDDVEISVEGLRSGPLSIDRLDAELSGVHVSFHDVLTQDVGSVYIERTREVATLSYEDLNAYLEATGRSVAIGGAPEGEVVLTGSVEVLGQEISASARAGLATENGALVVTPSQLDTGTAIDQASRLLLRQRFSFVVPLDPLPFGQVLTDVRAGADTVTVEVRGTGAIVDP